MEFAYNCERVFRCVYKLTHKNNNRLVKGKNKGKIMYMFQKSVDGKYIQKKFYSLKEAKNFSIKVNKPITKVNKKVLKIFYKNI